ncbi:hypothetical protein HELRODRAFT_189421 [Helobdella robusta]|uniref:POU domain protein n=1 Tax=Helobdella robusta TaxID=6412 RepID=T1FR18_HELRO|nr:hypothetical protein HELRODRAFT_189421 [Helobdella robusta]ESN94530.1 hypothetical protein HELRODRAFT_189421 [Helobdella robusta]
MIGITSMAEIDLEPCDSNGAMELNGDPIKLVHSAIIKQDVMLSCRNTSSPSINPLHNSPHRSINNHDSWGMSDLLESSKQDPLSSIFNQLTLPIAGSTALNNVNTTSHKTLNSSPYLTSNNNQNSNMNSNNNSINNNNNSNNIKNFIQQLTSGNNINHLKIRQQPLQIIHNTNNNINTTTTKVATSTTAPTINGSKSSIVPVRHLLIPVSNSNGLQQLISIPLSLAAGVGSQIQLLATSNGQLIVANLNNGSKNVENNDGRVGCTLIANKAVSTTTSLSSNAIQSHSSAPSTSSSTSCSSQHSDKPLLSQVICKNVENQAVPLNLSSTQLLQTLKLHLQQTSSIQKICKLATVPLSPSSTSSLSPSSSTNHISTTNGLNLSGTSHTSSTANHVGSSTPNINQLLPNLINGSKEGTVVDGVNLDEIREFAKHFKIRRLSLGLTQTQVGLALSATEGPSYSQSAICRFEKLDITPKSAQKIKPVLEKWMQEAEERYKSGVHNLTELIGNEPSKKRKRRTSFTPQALEVLNEYFERNSHPSGNEMSELSDRLNYEREVVRVWFCNKRQALKNTIKKMKSNDYIDGQSLLNGGGIRTLLVGSSTWDMFVAV